ncbi:major facilitator superfamily domain-containing protein [Geopyxis carbonaria]|nr:major facilitator superfamily domain-containing protein [Geopyxis carbonaria]
MSAQYDPQTARILRRTDLYLLPFLALLFLLNSLDRSNIGNAESAGFTRYAGLQESDLNDAVAAFFIAFVALQPVGAALGKRAGAGRWVGSVMIGWGVLTAATAWVTTRTQLMVLRVCIGALEAGFYPTTVFYLSLFYTRYEFARRLGWFFGQYAVAGAFGGLVSYVVIGLFPSTPDTDTETQQPPHTPDGRWHSYQVLFVLEGLLTIAVAATTFFWLPTGPGSAWWLSKPEAEAAERRVLRDRFPELDLPGEELADQRDLETGGLLYTAPASPSPPNSTRRNEYVHRSSSSQSSADSDASSLLLPKDGAPAIPSVGGDAALSSLDIFSALTDWHIWALLLLNICFSVPATAFSIFLPLVLKGLGASTLSANLLTVPPFLLGAASLWTVSHYSDQAGRRMPFILLGLAINLAGLLAVCALPSSGAFLARYLALCIVLAGSFIASPLTVAWLSGNIEAPGKRAVALGINGWGNLAGVVAGYLFEPAYAPGYEWPMRVTAGLVAFATVGYGAFWWALGTPREGDERVSFTYGL